MNGKRMMMAGGGVIVLVLVLGLLLMGRGGGGSSKKTVAIAQSNVVVAVQSIPQGTTFTAGQPLNTFFAVKHVPDSAVPFGAYTSLGQISAFLRSTGCAPAQSAGCRGSVTTTQTIYQNLPVVAGMFTSLGQFRTTAGPAFQIPYGYVGISMSFSDVNSVLGSIQAGDDVDLMASYTGGENGSDSKLKQTQFVLNDLRVIGVGGPPPAPSAPISGTRAPSASAAPSAANNTNGGSLLLLVRYQQALIIQHLKDFGASWTTSVVLRSSKETDIPHFRTTPVTANWMFVKQDNHFDFKPPY